jgi:hypothetical protein
MNLPSIPSASAVVKGVIMTAIALAVNKLAKPYLPAPVRDLLS